MTPLLVPTTDVQRDAATVRAIGERLQGRGDAAVAELLFFIASLIEDCVDVPAETVREVVEEIVAQRSEDEES
jgi:hypothetical protein